MVGGNSNIEIPPGFATPLAKIVPKSINDPISKYATVTTAMVRQAISSQSDHQGSIKRGRGRPPKQRPSVSIEAGPQDRIASLRSSMHQSKSAKSASGCQANVVDPSGLTLHDHIQASTSKGCQDMPVSLLIIEEPGKTNGTACCYHQTEKVANDLSDQLPCSIDANFLQQVVVAFDEPKESQEERVRLAKESISMNPSFQSTLLSILKEYGDITKVCPMESGYMLKSVLEVICKVVQELQQKHLTEINCNLLDSYYLVVKDAEKLKLNVGWLRTRLDEIKDAVKSIVETKKMRDEKNKRVEQIRNKKKDLDSMKAELEKLKSEVELKESLLNIEVQVTEELSSKINNGHSESSSFKRCH